MQRQAIVSTECYAMRLEFHGTLLRYDHYSKNKLEQGQRGGIMMMRVLKHIQYEEWLKELRMISLERRIVYGQEYLNIQQAVLWRTYQVRCLGYWKKCIIEDKVLCLSAYQIRVSWAKQVLLTHFTNEETEPESVNFPMVIWILQQ